MMKSLFALAIVLALAPASLAGDSQGIAGHMTAALGNALANPRSYQCAQIFDASGQTLIATATCSGDFGQFRTPLATGKYVVEFDGIEPHRQTVEVIKGRWTELGPKAPPGPMQ